MHLAALCACSEVSVGVPELFILSTVNLHLCSNFAA